MNKYNPNIHHRHTIRLKGYDYSQNGLYFITICVQNRECLFGEIIDGGMILNDAGKIVETVWLDLKIKYPNIDLHEYIVMPNHFHGILQIVTTFVGAGFARPNNNYAIPINAICDNNGAGEPRPYIPTLGNVIAYFKYQTAKQINLPQKLWQRNYYEHIIRDEKSYQTISKYIMNNPVNWQNNELLRIINHGK